MSDKNDEIPNRECFICGKGEEVEGLSDSKARGRPALEQMATEKGDNIILDRMKVPILSYHQSCKLEMYNTSKMEQRKRKSDPSNADDNRSKRRRTGANEGKVFLPYKNKCILCNELVRLYLKNPKQVKKTYSKPDNDTSSILKNQFLGG